MNWMDFLMRILFSILLGFLIGLERQITGRTTGIRINILISMGCCLFLMFPIISGSDEVFRIASYIVSDVGFLCSGSFSKTAGLSGDSIPPLCCGVRPPLVCWPVPEIIVLPQQRQEL